MRFNTLALATAISALAGAAAAGPLGGVGGGLGGALGGAAGAAGGIGHGVSGSAGGHGGGGLSGGVGGAIGGPFGTPFGAPNPAAHTTTHLGGGVSASLTGVANRSATGALHATGSLDSSASAGAFGHNAGASAHGSDILALHGQAQLAGLSAGQTVRDAEGRVIGTVESIEQAKDGLVTGVLITTANGERRILRLEPGLMRVANGAVVTTERLGAVARGSARRTAQASASTATATGASAMARANRMGPVRASATGVAHANARAGLAAAAPATNSLSGLNPGMTVRTASGRTIGTVSRVERSADGTVRAVLVRAAGGARRVVALAPRSLSISGEVVTTTQTAGSLRQG